MCCIHTEWHICWKWIIFVSCWNDFTAWHSALRDRYKRQSYTTADVNYVGRGREISCFIHVLTRSAQWNWFSYNDVRVRVQALAWTSVAVQWLTKFVPWSQMQIKNLITILEGSREFDFLNFLFWKFSFLMFLLFIVRNLEVISFCFI